MYTSLHNHTEASNLKLLDSTIKPEQLINKALEYDMKGIAITDHAIISNQVEILELRDKIIKNHPDFKVILGVEIYLIKEEDYKNTKDFYHFILLAKDGIGYKQIRQLISLAWQRAYMERGQWRAVNFYSDFENVFGKDKGHIIASTACKGGALDKAILARDGDTINFLVPWMQSTFGIENSFLEIQVADDEETKTIVNTVFAISQTFDIPYIITTDSHYLTQEDKIIHAVFLNSKEEGDSRELGDFYNFTYLMKEEEIFDIYSRIEISKEEIQKGLDNTNLVYNKIENFSIEVETNVPCMKIPEFTSCHLLKDWYKKYSYIAKFATSPFNQDRFLLYQVEQGMVKKQIPLNDLYIERINREMEILWELSGEAEEKRMSAYLNLTKDIIDLAWEVSFVGCGRGSSGGFLLNYLVDITQIDPIKLNLWEQRFLNLSRKGAGELPDIDNDFAPDKIPDIIELMRSKYGQNNVLRTLSIKTMTLKAAVISAMRGLNINNDEALVITAMVPAIRGKQYTLKQCIEGDEELELEPVPQFIEALKKYTGLYEAVEKLEGLWCGRSQHASSVYVFSGEEGYLEHNCLLRSSDGTAMTMFNKDSSDKLGALKEDLLSTEAQTKIQKCVSLMVEDGVLEWKGSLRETYNSYLHPDVLEYNDPKIWDAMANGSIPSLFQMDSMMGRIAMQKIHPNTVAELGLANDTMRLVGEKGQLSPIDRYVLFKQDPTAWDKEMDTYLLTQEERAVLHELLDETLGQCNQQESLMKLVMHPKVCGFDLKGANHARKVLAKKKVDQIEGIRKEIIEKGEALGVRSNFLSYVWDKCIKPQMSYSFCRIHSTQYGLIALQEANLACKYNPMYWACAVLSIDAGGTTDTQEEASVEEEESDSSSIKIQENFQEAEEDEVAVYSNGPLKVKKKTTDYGKVARAVNNINRQGYTIYLPDINIAKLDFKPDVEKNGIVFGFQAISTINEDLVSRIIKNRPYSSMQEFISKMEITTLQMIYLIKAGCFDKIENKPRQAIMEDYLETLAKDKVTKKTSMTSAAIKKALEMDIIGTEFTLSVRTYLYKKWIDENQLNKENKSYDFTDEESNKFFEAYFVRDIPIKNYSVLPSGMYSVKTSAFKKKYEELISPMMEWLKSEEGIVAFYEAEKEIYKKTIWNKYCCGSISSWEMSALCYYYHEHELSHLNRSYYNVADFDSLPEQPVVKEMKKSRNGTEYAVYNLVTIAGTILNTDNTKHILTLLTTSGVVDVKFDAGNYAYYNKTISEIGDNGKKHTIDSSWFKRGNKVLVSGIRRENMFFPKRDYSNNFSHTVKLILSIENDGYVATKNERDQGTVKNKK